jgi:hypothetical protein
MNMLVSSRRILFTLGMILSLAMVGVVMSPPEPTYAQGGATPIEYGEVTQGILDANGTAIFSFTAQPNDMIEIDVLAVDFVPIIDLQDSDEVTLFTDNLTLRQTHIGHIHHTSQGGQHFIVVRGGNQGDTFTLSLMQVQMTLPTAIALDLGQTVQGEVVTLESPVVYTFSADTDNALFLSVHGLTEGFYPTILLMTDTGKLVAEIDSEFLFAFTFTIEPGDENYILWIGRGLFPSTAQFEVSLVEHVGLTVMPTEGCFIATDFALTLRSGGSINHPVMAIFDPGTFLVVIGLNPTNGSWLQVELSNGLFAWIPSQIILQQGNCADLVEVDFLPPPTLAPAGVTPAMPTGTETPINTPTIMPSSGTATPLPTATP